MREHHGRRGRRVGRHTVEMSIRNGIVGLLACLMKILTRWKESICPLHISSPSTHHNPFPHFLPGDDQIAALTMSTPPSYSANPHTGPSPVAPSSPSTRQYANAARDRRAELDRLIHPTITIASLPHPRTECRDFVGFAACRE